MFAYLGLDPDGAYRLCVSTVELNPVGSRLERGPHRMLPENVRSCAQNPRDAQQAVAGLIALHKFCNGTEYGQEPPEFGDELPKRRRK